MIRTVFIWGPLLRRCVKIVSNMKLIFSTVQSPRAREHGFTFIELLVVLAVVALLAVTLFPALANTQPNSRAFQCLNNQRQIMLAWRMYGEDNNDLLPPNDYVSSTWFSTSSPNWVAIPGFESGFGTDDLSLLTNRNSLLSAYIHAGATYHCPADGYIDPQRRMANARSVSMNSAVGTIWVSSSFPSGLPLGAAVPGDQLNGPYPFGSTPSLLWLTYGKFSSIVRPSPANLFVIMDENPYLIDDGTIAIVAAASAGKTYLIDFPGGNHDGAGGIAFADGHSIIHKWRDVRTYGPQGIKIPGQGSSPSDPQSPDNPDCFYLASITSALG